MKFFAKKCHNCGRNLKTYSSKFGVLTCAIEEQIECENCGQKYKRSGVIGSFFGIISVCIALLVATEFAKYFSNTFFPKSDSLFTFAPIFIIYALCIVIFNIFISFILSKWYKIYKD